MRKLLSLAVALILALGMTALAVPDQGTWPLVEEPAELSIMLGADERIEIVEDRLHFRSFGNGEAHGHEDLGDLVYGLGYEVPGA